jgi:hypothetical protein
LGVYGSPPARAVGRRHPALHPRVPAAPLRGNGDVLAPEQKAMPGVPRGKCLARMVRGLEMRFGV